MLKYTLYPKAFRTSDPKWLGPNTSQHLRFRKLNATCKHAEHKRHRQAEVSRLVNVVCFYCNANNTISLLADSKPHIVHRAGEGEENMSTLIMSLMHGSARNSHIFRSLNSGRCHRVIMWHRIQE